VLENFDRNFAKILAPPGGENGNYIVYDNADFRPVSRLTPLCGVLAVKYEVA